jgi:nicotinate-nucleotide adenylyltransferase
LENHLSKKVGFFGGSFDPIHLGHLNIAIELAERHKLDEVFICPTSQSPFKKAKPPIASKEHRRAMVTAAISPLSHFTLLDFELQKSVPCYTIDTIREIISIDLQSKKKKKLFSPFRRRCSRTFSSMEGGRRAHQTRTSSHWKPQIKIL